MTSNNVILNRKTTITIVHNILPWRSLRVKRVGSLTVLLTNFPSPLFMFVYIYIYISMYIYICIYIYIYIYICIYSCIVRAHCFHDCICTHVLRPLCYCGVWALCVSGIMISYTDITIYNVAKLFYNISSLKLQKL